jgi:hypothetical protein
MDQRTRPAQYPKPLPCVSACLNTEYPLAYIQRPMAAIVWLVRIFGY